MFRVIRNVLPGRRQLLLVALAACVLTVSANTVLSEKPIGQLTPEQIEEGIQVSFSRNFDIQLLTAIGM